MWLFCFILSSADIKAKKNIMNRRQIIDTTLLKCYLQVSERKARGLKLFISCCFQNLPSFLIIPSSSLQPTSPCLVFAKYHLAVVLFPILLHTLRNLISYMSLNIFTAFSSCLFPPCCPTIKWCSLLNFEIFQLS